MTTTHLLYLHGFRSSPRSAKAQQMWAATEALRQQGQALEWSCPQLPPSPAQAWSDIQAQVADWPRDTMAVMGSSLGGFYATLLAEKIGCRAVIINPAVAPARDLARHIGEQSHSNDPTDSFYFRPEFIDEFKALEPYPISQPERYLTLIAKGDEVLDWREMVAHYPGTSMTLLDGGDHALTDFSPHVLAILRFLGLDQQP
ncbi:MAG: alpha/beta fold hydrolase [Rubrivivax sp.]|nr:MAG: alpha/beta fold hydrolase [Rubrivivax sp.]